MTQRTLTLELVDESATVGFGRKLALQLKPPLTLYLSGDLGAGKTTFSRGIIQALGHKGAVKSPTYTIVEPYDFADFDVYHFDLYRLNDAEELEFMGIRDYFNAQSICLIEWPEHGAQSLPNADLHLHISYADIGRKIQLQAHTELGNKIIESMI